jgi:hypothetical protein
MWDTVLVLVVVGVCAVLIGRTFYRQLAGKGSCGCGCSGGSCSTGKPAGPGCGCQPPDRDR